MSNVAGDPAAVAAVFCSTLVDEWARAGLVDAVVCPGSRSTPMALALLDNETLRVVVRLDERGAGYFAIGLALVSRRPTIVLTTSGTAAAELHAAVVEAHHQGVPLIVCTADRPPELRDVGAPQTIDQAYLYGRAVRWFADPGVPAEAARGTWRSLASRAVAEAAHGPHGPGPVHLNLPFSEPLVVGGGWLPTSDDLPPGRTAGPWHDLLAHERHPIPARVRSLLSPKARGLIVAGGQSEPRAIATAELASELGWPLLADPRSGCRQGDNVVAAADAILRHEPFAQASVPEVVVRVGDPWASKVLAGWLARSAEEGAIHIAFDPDWAWKDPGREVAMVVGGAPELPPLPPPTPPPPPAPSRPPVTAWSAHWQAAEEAAEEAIDEVLARHDEATEPGTARALYESVARGGSIVVASSMPVRDLEWFARPREGAPRVFANRGANGIDGVVSTALGVAASAKAPAPVHCLIGDLALLYDLSSLVRQAHGRGAVPMPAVITVLDNQGGGIFSFLPQAATLGEESFEGLFGTPQLPRVSDVLRGFGLGVTDVAKAAEYRPALAAAERQAAVSQLPEFVVVHTDRHANVEVHDEIHAAVAEAVARRQKLS